MFIGDVHKIWVGEIKLALKQFRERSIYYRSVSSDAAESFYSLLSAAENVKLDKVNFRPPVKKGEKNARIILCCDLPSSGTEHDKTSAIVEREKARQTFN